jgi:hypothetical protein
MFLQQSKDLIQQLLVTCHITRVNQHIIKIHNNTFIQQFKEHMIHHTLEGGRSSHQTKGHNSKLICTISARECSLDFIRAIHWHLVVPIPKVKFENTVAPSNLPNNSSILGNGKASFLV